MENNMQIWANK